VYISFDSSYAESVANFVALSDFFKYIFYIFYLFYNIGTAGPAGVIYIIYIHFLQLQRVHVIIYLPYTSGELLTQRYLQAWCPKNADCNSVHTPSLNITSQSPFMLIHLKFLRHLVSLYPAPNWYDSFCEAYFFVWSTFPRHLSLQNPSASRKCQYF
jgi:hypothetical protein